MMTVTSKAGRRLAKARARYDKAWATYDADQSSLEAYREACLAWAEKDDAADAVAGELIAQGFHDMDGED